LGITGLFLPEPIARQRGAGGALEVALTDEPLSIVAERVKSLREISDERDRRYEDRFKAMDEKTSLALTSSEKAVTKAETATEKRFDSVNEFRNTLKDQATTFITRPEVDAKFGAMEKDVQGLRESRSEAVGSAKAYALIMGVALLILQIGTAIMLRLWK
jgi:hypothetical protein